MLFSYNHSWKNNNPKLVYKNIYRQSLIYEYSGTWNLIIECCVDKSRHHVTGLYFTTVFMMVVKWATAVVEQILWLLSESSISKGHFLLERGKKARKWQKIAQNTIAWLWDTTTDSAAKRSKCNHRAAEVTSSCNLRIGGTVAF